MMLEAYNFFIPLIIGLPWIAAIILFSIGSRSTEICRLVGGAGFIIPGVMAIIYAILFYRAPNAGHAYMGLQQYDTGLGLFGINLTLGLNGISMPLFLLAGIVGLAAGIYALYSGAKRLHLYLALLLIMLSGLFGTFASVDLFFFYLFHEFALIPTFIMMGIWGGQARRSAAMEMTIYLTLGAMLALVGLLALYYSGGAESLDMRQLKSMAIEQELSSQGGIAIFGLLLFGFGILVSLWPLHSWAPRGYAAAPSSVAMLHAGVLKKFGLYGLLQVAAPILPMAGQAWSDLLMALALGNILIIGLVTIAQRDLKLMLGYSSVMHMGTIFLGIACFSVMGASGAVLLMFAHGLSTALLFMLSTSIYRRTHTYDLKEMGGLGQKTPLLAGFFIAATMASIGLPGFGNFWGEFTIFLSLWEQHPWLVAPAALGIVLSAIYGLRAAANIFFGTPTDAFKETYENETIQDIRPHERLASGILFAGLLILGIYPQWMNQKIQPALDESYRNHAPAITIQRTGDQLYAEPAVHHKTRSQ